MDGLVLFFIVVVFAVMGFVYGKKMHLKQMTAVLMQTGIVPKDQVDKLMEIVANYKKLRRQAAKEVKEAYKNLIVQDSLEKMKKEAENNG